MPSQLIPPSKSKQLGGLVLSPGGGLGGGLGTGGGDGTPPVPGNSFASKSIYGSLATNSYFVRAAPYGSLNSFSYYLTSLPYGSLDSQSFYGSMAYMTGIAVNVPDNAQPSGTFYGFFLKLLAYQGADIALLDLDMGVFGFARTKLRSTGKVASEFAYQSASGYVETTSSLALNTWYWITNGLQTTLTMLQKVTQPGGVVFDNKSIAIPSYGGTRTARLGVGYAVSDGSAPIPLDGSVIMAKLQYNQSNNLLPIPLADINPALNNCIAFWDGRQTVGVAAHLTDVKTGTYNLDPAVTNGIVILADGPYP